MIINYHDHSEPDPHLRSFVERRAATLDEWVSHLNDESACLDVAIFYDLRSDCYTSELCFRVNGQQIEAVGEGLQRTQSLERAFRELAERVDVLLTESTFQRLALNR